MGRSGMAYVGFGDRPPLWRYATGELLSFDTKTNLSYYFPICVQIFSPSGDAGSIRFLLCGRR
jgi:hypothetical protein